MPPVSAPKLWRSLGAALIGLLLFAWTPSDALAIRAMTWNVLNYPTAQGDSREDDMRTVMLSAAPDVLLAQEIVGFSGANGFLSDVLNVIEPGEWALAPFLNGPDTDNACYYRISTLDYVSQVVLSTAGRDINGYILRPDGYIAAAAQLRFYSMHLKAGTDSGDLSQRLQEAQVLRGHLNSLPNGTHFAGLGDFNIRSSTEAAYQELIGSQANNAGRLFDPINRPGTWNNSSSFADIHTQSPRTSNLSDGGATGGMDDRFDIILINDDFEDTEGIDFIPGSYVAYGQDGLHFNKSMIDPPVNTVVGPTVASALYYSSDHLPVIIEIQVPAMMITTAFSDLEFGQVIVGASALQAILVENPAVEPADDLDYSATAGTGFSVPVGTFSIDPGGLDAINVTMDTSTPGERLAGIIVTGDAPDNPADTYVATGTVLAHAVPSTEELAIVTSAAVDFGSHEPGQFSDQTASIYNVGFGDLQALLEVFEVGVDGPDAGRFSVVDFALATAGDTPAGFALRFDDAGASANTTYTATITFSTRDQQDLFGAADLANIVFDVEVFVEETGTPVVGSPMFRTFLLSSLPNPFNPMTLVRFELAQDSRVRLTIYDVQGRVMRTLLEGRRSAGPHEVRFDGRGDDGRPLASGVYLVRMDAGDVGQTRKLTLVR